MRGLRSGAAYAVTALAAIAAFVATAPVAARTVYRLAGVARGDATVYVLASLAAMYLAVVVAVAVAAAAVHGLDVFWGVGIGDDVVTRKAVASVAVAAVLTLFVLLRLVVLGEPVRLAHLGVLVFFAGLLYSALSLLNVLYSGVVARRYNPQLAGVLGGTAVTIGFALFYLGLLALIGVPSPLEPTGRTVVHNAAGGLIFLSGVVLIALDVA